MIEKVCPICKTVFIPTHQWVYVRGVLSKEKYFCRYSCMKKYDEREKAHPSKRTERIMRARRIEIEKYLDEGLSPHEITKRTGASWSTVKRYIEQIEIDRYGKTRKEREP